MGSERPVDASMGESIYDLFDRYYTMAQEELGWAPDFDGMDAGFVGTMLKHLQDDLY